MMAIQLNGQTTKLPEGFSLGELVDRMELDGGYLVVEHNGEPLRFAEARDLVLRDGDRLELVRPVAGG